MRKYEVMYIIRPDIEQEVVQAAVEKFQGIISNGGGELQSTMCKVNAVLRMRSRNSVMAFMFWLTSLQNLQLLLN
jgi:hypothetical protein